MNKRDVVLEMVHGEPRGGYVPSAFFLHFDPAYQRGQAAVNKHLEFFHHTGMDFVKIQYEQTQPRMEPVRKPEDWLRMPYYPQTYFDATVAVVEGLVKAAQKEALVILTLYSPLMWAMQLAEGVDLAAQLRENPGPVAKGLEIMTENVLNLVRRCKQVGVDGFYVSTQGGESFRLKGTDFFQRYIKPTDLAVWSELTSCRFNVLHICDYVGAYDDITPFVDYPGDVVNCSLHVGDRTMSPQEAADFFKRPFMGGMERKGMIATGRPGEIREAAEAVLAVAPRRFVLAADCTVPGDTSWDNLKIAIDTAHRHHG